MTRQSPRIYCVTGAGRGIGFALTKALLGRGDAVIATVRSPAGAEALAPLRGPDSSLEIIELDVLDEASLARFGAALDGRPIDVLIANAGAYIGRGGLDDAETDKRAFEATLMTNVWGPFATIRAAAPSLKAAPGSKVAILGSRMGSNALSLGKGNSFPYRASKAAATNLARNLAGALSPDGIAVGVFHPGWVRTEMGGPQADIDVETSVRGLLARIDELDLDRTGCFLDYAGDAIPL